MTGDWMCTSCGRVEMSHRSTCLGCGDNFYNQEHEGTKLYRYEAVRYSVVIDAEMEIFGTSRAKLELREFFITARTPKGVWIGFSRGDKWKWVSNTSRKRYAHPTKAEASEAYKQRKLAFVRHAKAQLKRAEEDLSLL